MTENQPAQRLGTGSPRQILWAYYRVLRAPNSTGLLFLMEIRIYILDRAAPAVLGTSDWTSDRKIRAF